jgi:peptidoglycan DL-endopeptidase CwlO
MSARTASHRAATVRTSPLATVSKAVSANPGSFGRQAAVVAVASGLVLASGVSANAAGAPALREAVTTPLTIQAQVPVQAPAEAQISFDRPKVSSIAAPVVEQTPAVEAPAAPAAEAPAAAAPAAPARAAAPAVAAPAAAAPAAQVQRAAAPAQAAPAVPAAAPAPAPAAAPAPAPAAAPAPASSGIGAALVASAMSQIGTFQDCTAMVEKALRSVGKSVGDIAPEHFYRYGTVVSDPQPGDLMIRPGHVAIYVGNGMAVSGGWEGSNTALHPASYLGGSSFVRVS